MSLLSAERITHGYGAGSSRVTVLDDFSLDIASGETIALAGRSGCGKSTLARLLLGLEMPDAGAVMFNGRPLAASRRAEMKAFRQQVQLVFQDSPGAVDPRSTVFDIVSEPLVRLSGLSRGDARRRVAELLDAVGIDPQLGDRSPGQLSGGQLQRVCIARAIAPQPRLVVLDEAVSSLDVILQAQIFALLVDLQRRYGLAWLFITHDLRLAERFCSRVVVMDSGRVAENTLVGSRLQLSSAAGKALQAAILPAIPGMTRPGRSAPPLNVPDSLNMAGMA